MTKKKKLKIKKRIKWTLFFLLCLSLLFLLFQIYFLKMPSIKNIRGCFKTSMYKVYLCPNSPGYVHFDLISKLMVESVVVSEDYSFWGHKGFDWVEIKESFKTNIKNLSFSRGGSTITQQLVKNLYLSKEKAIKRKIIEAITANKVEQKLGKKEILEKYLNVVQFGPNIFGIKKAAEFYFFKHPSELNLQESTFLASLLPSPVKYSRTFRKEGTFSRYNQKRMKNIAQKLVRKGVAQQEDLWWLNQNEDGIEE